VLADPPFSRLDFVSCRNLLIYLRPEAQAKVIARFHFALKPGAILLLGTAETIVEPDGMFELLSKPDRIYRRIGRNRTSSHDTGPQPDTDRFSDIVRRPPISVPARTRTRPASLAELGRRLVIDTYAPAAILIDAANEILFSLGPTDRYLRLAPGHSTHGLLAMARPGLRTKLRAALNTARENGAKTVVTAKIADGRRNLIFNLEILPVLEAGEDMLLVCFVEIPEIGLSAERDVAAGDVSRIAELERELEATRGELQETLRELEQSGEAQKATDEEALSVNEEHQSTNEELLTSKEELQSLNEELTALNAQLQETLERQRTTADDLQNVLYSTNVATLFLDMDLKIRFFTPATTSLFAVIAGDVGRPLSDLAALTPDGELEGDCRRVIQSQDAIERQIQSKDGIWFRRSILPYRVHGNRVEGVVITFTDVTARIHAAEALEAAKRQAETANAEKSRFLAAASHDLRQPLQTLALLASLLGKSIEGEKAVSLMARLDETVGAMTSMLDTLLDINEIEAGSVRAHPVPFPIGVMLRRIRDEFIYHAQAKELKLEVVDCSLVIESDPRLLEQMLRNLLSNAIKYTKRGRILMGCRRQHGALRIEILDTGIGIPEASLGSIFDEYTQIDNAARERSRGLGLGLAIVKRLSVLLGHRISVTSRLHKGSCFSVLVPLASSAEQSGMSSGHDGATDPANQTARILLVEDDPALRELLQLSLREEGHHVVSAPDGIAALATLPAAAPELLLVDFNLPNGMNGVELAARIRKIMGKAVPVIILTGNIAADAKRDAARLGYGMMRKPIKHGDLMKAIGHLIAATQLPAQAATNAAQASVTTDDVAAPIVYVVDDDANIRAAMIAILENSGRVTQGFATGEAFLQHYHGGTEACLLIDAVLPGMSGIDLIETLRASGQTLPAIMVTGQGDLTMAVRAMKAGATDFIEKPLAEAALLGCVERALEQSHDDSKRMAWHNDAANHVSGLTTRQREIMTLVLAGHPSKNIAADLGISQRTVENHRASIMRKTGAASVPALARLALAAEQG
jgi:two-component system CheB/CheR fusion protein